MVASGLSGRWKGILKTVWQWNKGKLGKGFKPVLVRFQNPLNVSLVPAKHTTQYHISQLELYRINPIAIFKTRFEP